MFLSVGKTFFHHAGRLCAFRRIPQSEQMLVLPVPLALDGIHGVGGSIEGLLGIYRRAKSMSGNMDSCHRLSRRMGSRAGGTVFLYISGSSMSVERSPANH